MTGPEAEVLCRRLGIHLRKNNFEACRDILDQEEKDMALDVRGLNRPEALAELDLDLRTVNLLERAGYLYLEDMRGISVFRLERELRGAGYPTIRKIGSIVSEAFRKDRAYCL